MARAITGINEANRTQNFLPSNEYWILEERAFNASVEIQEGTVLSPEVSGSTTTGRLVQMGVENAGGADFYGILAEEIRSTDEDYATAGKTKKVWVPVNQLAEAFFTVGAGTFTQADVFKTVQIASNGRGLDVDTLGLGARISKFISGTRGKCRFTLPQTEVA